MFNISDIIARMKKFIHMLLVIFVLSSCATLSEKKSEDEVVQNPALIADLEQKYDEEDQMRTRAWEEIRETLSLLAVERKQLEEERAQLKEEQRKLDEQLKQVQAQSLENDGLLSYLEQIKAEQNRESQRLEELGLYLKQEKENLSKEDALLKEKTDVLDNMARSLNIQELNLARMKESTQRRQLDLDSMKTALDTRQKALETRENQLNYQQNKLEEEQQKSHVAEDDLEEKRLSFDKKREAFEAERRALEEKKGVLLKEREEYDEEKNRVTTLIAQLNREKSSLERQQDQLKKDQTSLTFARKKLENDHKALRLEAENAQQPLVFFESYALSRFGTYEPRIEEILSGMTLEEKVGQVMLISLQESSGAYAQTYSGEIKKTIETVRPGGVIFFKSNIDTIPQTTSFIEDLKNSANLPLFVTVDEEGGLVTRISKNKALHATLMPVSGTVGNTGDPIYSYMAGQIIGSELHALGFNMNMAPVADLNTNPDNPVIGVRAFGDDPYEVGTMVATQVLALKNSRIIPVLKHFPGHGDTKTDSHYGLARVGHSPERLRSTELVPFRMGIDAGCDVIMTGHIIVSSLEKDLPATFSSISLQDILRKEMGFNGIIMTDSMGMGAITKYYDNEKAPVMAFLAGVDVILTPDYPVVAFKALLNAVKGGQISERRLDESVRRILWIKLKYGLFDEEVGGTNPDRVLGSKTNWSRAKEIREASKR